MHNKTQKMYKSFSLVLFTGWIISSFAQSPTITMGPYLQLPTKSSMIVMWRTNIATESRVKYGSSPTNLTSVSEDLTPKTNHSISITGLSPFTKYYYQIENASQILSADTNQHFTTSPVPGTVQPIRVWVIGDFGKGNTSQAKVRDSYVNYTGANHTDVWLWLGDNAYSDGTDSDYQTKVFDSIYGYHKNMKYMPFMPCPGNHDYLSVCNPTCTTSPPNHKGPYYDIVEVPKNGEAGGVASGYELYYSYDYGNIHFISLNSELSSITPFAYNWTGANPTGSFNCNNSPMCKWLEDDLKANNQTWTVVYFHQPPYTDGSHDATQFWEVYMKAMRENFVPILEKYGVDLVLCGHSHVYERTYLLKGHYDDRNTFNPNTMIVDSSSGNYNSGEAYIKDPSAPKNQNGTVYVVAGNSGSKDDNAPLQYPAVYYGSGCDTCIGSFVIDVNGNRLDGKYLDAYGQILDDFTILKQPLSTPELKKVINNLKVYPNPFSNQTKVEYTINNATEIEIGLFDIQGKLVKKYIKGKQSEGNYTIIIDGEQLNLSKGIYSIRFITPQSNTIEKLIKFE
jgi:acid phosphatase type 7